jgi:uncharacterized protein (DUF2384 family)
MRGLRYDTPMKPPPDNPEFTRFTEAMRHIMGVSKNTMTRRKEAAKRISNGQEKRGPKPRVVEQQ